MSRAGTPQPVKSPYAHHDTHNIAAASMFDLSNARPGQRGSHTSLHLRPHASDMNLRTRFGANNASSTSLAAPGPGFSSRPSTANGKPKPWVNPLDVHFMRGVSSGPPTPRSPLAHAPMQLPPTPTTGNAETGSIFGEEADDMVDAVMSSVKKREAEAKAAREREKELEKQRETARLEMERLERQKSTESNLAIRPPSAPRPEPEASPRPSTSSSQQGPVFRGNVDSRPGSRNGPSIPMRAPLLHQGPPPTGPPTQCLPKLPGQAPPRQGPLGPPAEGARPPGPGMNGPGMGSRPNGPVPPSFRTQGPQPHAAGSHGPPNGPSQPIRPYRPPPLQGFGPLGGGPTGLQSLKNSSLDDYRSESPAPRSPAVQRAPAFTPEVQSPVEDGRSTPGPERRGQEPLISTLTSPSNMTSPSGSISRLSLDDEPVDMFARPVIRDVDAKRDTLTFSSARQQSLSMRIEELEKTLITQQIHQAQKAMPQTANRRMSTGSSIYSESIKVDDEDDDDGPILSIQPAPLRIAAPQAPVAPVAPAATPGSRSQSPFHGPPRRGAGPRRPTLEEYGIPSNQVAVRARGATPAPSSRSGSTDNYSSHSSPPSRTNTPQLRLAGWRRDPAQPAPVLTGSPETTITAAPAPGPERPRLAPVIDTGFNFGFGPGIGVAAPPTPDSTTWPLSPSSDKGSGSSTLPPPAEPQPPKPTAGTSGAAAPPPTGSGKFTRSHVPPPLNIKFNFSPDAPSRDPTLSHSGKINSSNTIQEGGLWTPPLRSAPLTMAGSSSTTADGRPTSLAGASGGGRLAASPSLISQFPDPNLPRDDDSHDDGAFMGIGMARGPSIREVRKPSGHGMGRGHGHGHGTGRMVDSFGTGFI